jgi:hypothetical protein
MLFPEAGDDIVFGSNEYERGVIEQIARVRCGSSAAVSGVDLLFSGT